jgi:hypothetical protein
MADVSESGFGGYLFRPALDGLALYLDAAAAVAAGQVVVMGVGAAAPVQRLAARVPDGIDEPVLAEHLKMPVDGREADVLTASPELSVNLLGAGESGQHVKSG